MYDGVASDGAINLAIDIDIATLFLKPIHTLIVEITNKYGYGMYKFETLKKSKIILDSGEIVWQ